MVDRYGDEGAAFGRFQSVVTGRNRPKAAVWNRLLPINLDLVRQFALLGPQPIVEVVLRLHVLRMLVVGVGIWNGDSASPEREPLTIPHIANHSHILQHASLAGTELDEIDLRLDQATSIRSTHLVRVIELEHVILPEANWANVV